MRSHKNEDKCVFTLTQQETNTVFVVLQALRRNANIVMSRQQMETFADLLYHLADKAEDGPTRTTGR